MITKEDQKKPELISCLSNSKVRVKYIKRMRGNIQNPKHVAYGGMLEGAEKVLVPKKLRDGRYTNILTNEEKAFLEHYMQLDEDALSIYKKNNNYWDNCRVRLTKDDLVLDKSDPDQYIKYKVLLTNDSLVAPSLDKISHKQTYMYVLIEEGDEEKAKVRKLTSKQNAFKYFGKYEDNKEVLRYMLRSLGKATAKNTRLETLQGWLGDYIDSDSSLVSTLFEDPYLETKVMINTGVDLGVIKVLDNEYFDNQTNKKLAEGNFRAELTAAAKYLNEPRNQEIKLSIQARINNAKE